MVAPSILSCLLPMKSVLGVALLAVIATVRVEATSDAMFAPAVTETPLSKGHRSLQHTAMDTQLVLMDAVTDEILSNLSTTLVTWIHAESTVPRYTVQAVCLASQPESMMWTYNGAVRTESTAPWALCGNQGMDFWPCQKLVSDTDVHVATIAATPTSKNGPSVGPNATTILVVAPTQPVTVTLLDADLDRELVTLSSLSNTWNASTASLPLRFNVRVNLHEVLLTASLPQLSHVQVTWNQSSIVYTNTEQTAPFTLFGNAGNDYWSSPAALTHGLVQLTVSLHGASLDRPILVHTLELWIRDPTGGATTPLDTPAPARTLTPTLARTSTPTLAPTSTPTMTPTSAMELMQLTLSSTDIDLSVPTSTVVQVALSSLNDMVVEMGFVQATSELVVNTNVTHLPLLVPLVGDGATNAFAMEWAISPYTPPGRYALSLIVWDTERTEYVWTSDMLQARGWPFELTVASSRSDTTPPELVTLGLVSSSSTSASRTMVFHVVVRDDASGLAFGTVEATSTGTGIEGDDVVVSAEFGPWSSLYNGTASTAVQVDASVSLVFDVRGTYKLRVYLYDAVHNQRIVEPTDLAALSMPSSLIVP